MNIITPSIEVIESPNKALIIGDSFLNNLNTYNSIYANNFVKQLFIKSFELHKGSKVDGVFEGLMHHKTNLIRNQKEVIGLYLLIQYDRMSLDQKAHIAGDKKDLYTSIGAYFGTQYASGNIGIGAEILAETILLTINNEVGKRIRENKALRAYLQENTAKNTSIALSLNENFFLLHETLGSKNILPSSIPFHRYHSRGLVDHDNTFLSIHNLLVEPKNGFDIHTIMNRIKQKGIYDNILGHTEKKIIGFSEKINALGFKSDKTKKSYFISSYYNQDKQEYALGLKAYLDPRKYTQDDFCMTYLYNNIQKDRTLVLPDTDIEKGKLDKNIYNVISTLVQDSKTPFLDNVDIQQLVYDFIGLYKSIIRTQQTQKKGSYTSDIIDTIKDHIDDEKHKTILSFYQDKADIIGIEHNLGQKVLLEGTNTYAIIRTTSTPNHSSSVEITLYEKDGTTTIGRIEYTLKDNIIIIDDTLPQQDKTLYNHIKHIIKKYNVSLDGFSSIQQDMFIDGCVRSVKKVIYGYGDKDNPEKVDDFFSIIKNITNRYLIISPKELVQDTIVPSIELPEATFSHTETHIQDFIKDVTDKKYRSTYTSFLKESVAQRIGNRDYKNITVSDALAIAGYRYSIGYRKILATSKKDIISIFLHASENDIYNTMLNDIILERLYTFQDNKQEDKKRYIINNIAELQRAYIASPDKATIQQHLLEFIAFAQKKEQSNVQKGKKENKGQPLVSIATLTEAINHIIQGPTIPQSAVKNTTISQSNLQKYIDEVKADSIFEYHIQHIDDRNIATAFNALSDKVKIFYIKWLQKTGHIAVYMNLLQEYRHEDLYKSIGVLWYKEYGYEQITILLQNIDYVTPKDITLTNNDGANSDDNNENQQNKTLSLEKNMFYRFFYRHYIQEGNVFITILPRLDKVIADVQKAYGVYVHETTLSRIRSMEYAKQEHKTYIKNVIAAIKENTIEENELI